MTVEAIHQHAAASSQPEAGPSRYSFATRAIHAGAEPDESTGAVIKPISLSTTYAQSGVGIHKGFEYSRSGNPNRNDLETLLESLEVGAGSAIAFGSGSAATSAAVQWATLTTDEGGARQHDGEPVHILSVNDVYGGTFRYLARVAKSVSGVAVDFLDMNEAGVEGIRKAIRLGETKIIWVESPTNPTLVLPPVQEIAALLSELPEDLRPILLVDNTFLSPYWSNPLTLGADLVLQSTSKYINGHSDVIGGALIVRAGLERKLGNGLRFLQNASGGIPSPFDAYLTMRGVKTLPLRALKHGLNALQIAHKLSSNPLVESVTYPGLIGSEFYDRAKSTLSQQAVKDLTKLGWFTTTTTKGSSQAHFDAHGQITLNGYARSHSPKEVASGGFPYSGMISIRLKTTSASEAERQTEVFLQNLKLFALAESLGGVESLAEAPWKMTHGGIPPAEREKLGITSNLVRLSVGIEDADDLLEDIEKALQAALQ